MQNQHGRTTGFNPVKRRDTMSSKDRFVRDGLAIHQPIEGFELFRIVQFLRQCSSRAPRHQVGECNKAIGSSSIAQLGMRKVRIAEGLSGRIHAGGIRVLCAGIRHRPARINTPLHELASVTIVSRPNVKKECLPHRSRLPHALARKRLSTSTKRINCFTDSRTDSWPKSSQECG